MPLPVDPYDSIPRSALALVHRARASLRLNQAQLAAQIGSSKRTVSRWGSGSSPNFGHVIKLARLVDPVDRQLATALAAVAGETLESLGIVPPAPPPSEPPPPLAPAPLPGRLIVHAVICAAADALQATPATARPAVLAAFRMAKELGMSVEEVETALAGAAGG